MREVVFNLLLTIIAQNHCGAVHSQIHFGYDICVKERVSCMQSVNWYAHTQKPKKAPGQIFKCLESGEK